MGGKKEAKLGPSEVSVNRPKLEPLSYLKMENSRPKPISRNPTFYSTSPQCSSSPSPVSLLWTLCVLLLVSIGYSSRGVSRQEHGDLNMFTVTHVAFCVRTGRLDRRNLQFYRTDSLNEALHRKQTGPRSRSLCSMSACRVWTRTSTLSTLDLLCACLRSH